MRSCFFLDTSSTASRSPFPLWGRQIYCNEALSQKPDVKIALFSSSHFPLFVQFHKIAGFSKKIAFFSKKGLTNRFQSSIIDKQSSDGRLVKRLRHQPLTLKTWVRFPYRSPQKESTLRCALFFVVMRSAQNRTHSRTPI